MQDFERQLNNYRLTTAEITYHMPDYPKLLQAYIWQELDLLPDFPELNHFLDFWENNLDGRIHSVSVMHAELIQPGEFQHFRGDFTLH